MNRWFRRWFAISVCAGATFVFVANLYSETCTTQSQMAPAERDTLAHAAQTLALKVQANDQQGIKAATIPEFADNFDGIGTAVSATAAKLTGDTAEVEQLYLLDASGNHLNADGAAPDAEFVCPLNKGTTEADFSIRALPPGHYAFAMVEFVGASPWTVSMLLRKDGTDAAWKLAGLFPKASTAAGHDGLWYWGQGRAMAAKKQLWVALLDYQEARRLLQPAVFVSSTHLENLRVESSSAVPPEIGDGISADAPLIVKRADGKQYRFTSIAPDDTLHQGKLDVAAHMVLDSSISDPVALRQDNLDAMSALVNQHPELRENFHGVWIFAEAPGQPPVVTQAAMSDIH